MTYADRIAEQKAYYALCAEARALGIPTSLDDPRSPKTVQELRDAVAAVPVSAENRNLSAAWSRNPA